MHPNQREEGLLEEPTKPSRSGIDYFGPLAKHSPSICTRRSSQCSPKIEGEVVSRKIFGPRHLECSRMSDLRGYRKFSDASRSHTSIDNHTALSTMSMLDKLAQNYIRQSLDGGIMI